MQTHHIDMIMDFQFGSTGKGLLAGYLSKRGDYDTTVCAFGTNAGHTYIDKSRELHVMTQQLPTSAVASPTVKKILIGPGAAIHIPTLMDEINKYEKYLKGKTILIHPHAAVVTDEHQSVEKFRQMGKIGSTTKGVGQAYIQRLQRDPEHMNVIAGRKRELYPMVATVQEYREALETANSVIVEGSQGFSLSMYHGFYPYVTSRDVTPWQIAADCGLPFSIAPYIHIWGTVRTLPIRVNNRDGTSGPGYDDQRELEWQELGIEPELTTVTKLPRRIFTFSQEQITDACWHCSQYWHTNIFLNFANYLERNGIQDVIQQIETPRPYCLNPPHVKLIGVGPDDSEVLERNNDVYKPVSLGNTETSGQVVSTSDR